jgi:hypothetical protein
MFIIMCCSHWMAKTWHSDKKVKLVATHSTFTKSKHIKQFDFLHFITTIKTLQASTLQSPKYFRTRLRYMYSSSSNMFYSLSFIFTFVVIKLRSADYKVLWSSDYMFILFYNSLCWIRHTTIIRRLN